jgi:hypothetical protein
MKFVIDFLSELLKYIEIEVANKPPDESAARKEEEVKDAYKWFIDKLKDTKQTELAQSNDPYFLPGKIYVFKYEPDKNKHPFYDKHPIALMLGKMPAKEGMMNVCINLSWYPPKARKFIVDEIRKAYAPMIDKEIKRSPLNAKKQASFPIDLYALKERLDQFGFSWAIRTYLPSRIKAPAVVVAYEHWDKVIKMDQPRIFPEIQGSKIKPLVEIYKEFETVYLKRQDNKKGEIKKRRDEAKKQMKFKFIK